MKPGKPFSAACERNQEPILNVLKRYIDGTSLRLLEVGSGTAQHAIYMARLLPQVTWITSDVEANHAGIRLWLEEADIENIEGPLAFEVGKDSFPAEGVDCIFTANSFHIMSFEHVAMLIALSAKHLRSDGLFIIYGPFNYNGDYTSASNAAFDQQLRSRNSYSGIRDKEAVEEMMQQHGLMLLEDIAMPANNRILVFKKQTANAH